MKDYILEDFKSPYSYRVKYVSGIKAGETVRQDYHRSINLGFMFFIKGRGRMNIEGTSHEVSEGDVVMFNPSEFFLSNIDNDVFHERITVLTNLNMINSFPCDALHVFSKFYKREKGKGNIICSKVAKKHGIDNLFYELLEIVREESELKEPLAICKVIELLGKIGKVIDDTTYARREEVFVNTLIDNVLRYIDDNFTKDITIQDIADRFNVHRSYISHEFAKQLGISLWNYIILRRIHKFNSLMTPDSSIEELAYKVGFNNYSNFFRLYKKHMGITPMEYKRQFKKSE